MANNQPSNKGTGIAIILILLVIFGIAGSCSSKQHQAEETQKFSDQMHQDPNTWNKEQKDRYNDFSDWEAKQQENK